MFKAPLPPVVARNQTLAAAVLFDSEYLDCAILCGTHEVGFDGRTGAGVNRAKPDILQPTKELGLRAVKIVRGYRLSGTKDQVIDGD
jgi:hypothetical protein